MIPRSIFSLSRVSFFLAPFGDKELARNGYHGLANALKAKSHVHVGLVLSLSFPVSSLR